MTNWQEADPEIRDFCEDTLDRLKKRENALGIQFKPAFSCYDRFVLYKQVYLYALIF